MEKSGPDEAPDGGEDPRLASLDERLKAAHQAEAERTQVRPASSALTGKGVSQGNRVISALLGMPFGGLVVGFAIDEGLGSRPKAMLAMLFLGIVAAFVQVFRISRERPE